jgi:hypothetical protein
MPPAGPGVEATAGSEGGDIASRVLTVDFVRNHHTSTDTSTYALAIPKTPWLPSERIYMIDAISPLR